MRSQTDKFESPQLKSKKECNTDWMQAVNEATIMGKLIHPFIVRYS
jgi:hypothetical protein